MGKYNATQSHCFFLLFIIFLVSGCSNSSRDEPSPESNPTALATVALQLVVTDTAGYPVEGVQASVIGTNISAASNVDGTVEFTALPAATNMVFEFSKPGYAKQFKPLTTQEYGALPAISVGLIKREAPQTFYAGDATSLRGSDGAQLVVAENAFVDGDGNFVTGEIQLSMTSVNVDSARGLAAFPGSFSGIPEDATEPSFIISYGCTEFHFTQDGERLNLAEEQTAQIELPMYIDVHPTGEPVAIGDKIPLWSLDEQSGLWKQESEGTVVANALSPTGFAMRAEVSHFSWWNTDYYPPEPAAGSPGSPGGNGGQAQTLRGQLSITAILVDEDGEQIEDVRGYPVQITANGRGTFNNYLTGLGFTDTGDVLGGFEYSVSASLVSRAGFTVQSDIVTVTVPRGESRSITLPIYQNQLNMEAHALYRPTATSGTDYGKMGDTNQIMAKRFIPPLSFRINSGALPDGLTITPQGTIVGTPVLDNALPQRYSTLIEVQDAAEQTDFVSIEIEVYPALEAEYTSSHFQPRVGRNYTGAYSSFRINDGMPKYTFYEAADARLPPGMSIDQSNGAVIGTAERVAHPDGGFLDYYDNLIKVRVVDGNGAEAFAEYEMQVNWAPLLVSDLDDMPEENEPFDVYIQLGESLSYTPLNKEGWPGTWYIKRVSLHDIPEDLIDLFDELITDEGLLSDWAEFEVWGEIDPTTGELRGQPTGFNQVRSYENIVMVANGLYPGFEDYFLVNVHVGLEPPELDAIANQRLVPGQSLSVQTVNRGGRVQNFSVQNLPSWASFDATIGEIKGQPALADVGVYADVVITASNPSGQSSTPPFTIEVVTQAQPPKLSGEPPQGIVGQAYSWTFMNTGGAPDNCKLSGNLAAGLSFNAANIRIEGVPLVAGLETLTVECSNAGGSDSIMAGLQIVAGEQAPLSFAQAGLVQRTESDANFSNLVRGGSGAGAVSYSSSDTTVASVDAMTGEVSIHAPGTTVITATKASDGNYQSASASYTLQVSAGSSLTGDAPDIYSGIAYQFQPILIGLNATSWELIAGDLPSGLMLDTTTGQISGSTSVLSDSQLSFSIRAHIQGGLSVDGSWTVNVVAAREAPELWLESNFAQCSFFGEEGCQIEMDMNKPYSLKFSALSELPVEWSFSGDLPAGMAWTSDGNEATLSGSPEEGIIFPAIILEASNPFGSSELMLALWVFEEQDPLEFNDAGPVNINTETESYSNLALGGSSEADIIYSSSDKTIATVHWSTGVVTVLQPGTVEITALKGGGFKYRNIEASYTLNIDMVQAELEWVVASGTAIYAKKAEQNAVDLYATHISESETVMPGASDVISELRPDPLSVNFDSQPNTHYFVAAETQSSNGKTSPLSEPWPVRTLAAVNRLDNGDAFGTHLALAGDVLAVKLLNVTPASAASIYIYERIEGRQGWTFTQSLPAQDDWWGKALAVHKASDGSYRIAAGSTSDPQNPESTGRVVTYVKQVAEACNNNDDDDGDGTVDEADCINVGSDALANNGIWVVEATLEGVYPETAMLTDNLLILGVPSSSEFCEAGITRCGKVMTWQLEGSLDKTWAAQSPNTILPTERGVSNHGFGYAFANAGEVVAISAFDNNLTSCEGRCRVYLFSTDNGSIRDTPIAELWPSDDVGKHFGSSLAIIDGDEGGMIAVGDPKLKLKNSSDNSPYDGPGAVYLYRRPANMKWSDGAETEILRPPGPQLLAESGQPNFGSAVAFHEDTLWVGESQRACINGDANCGALWAYHNALEDSLVNTLPEGLMPYTHTANSYSGYAVAISEGKMACTAYEGSRQTSPGKVVLYDLE